MSFLTEYYDEYRNLPLRKTVMCRPEDRWAKLEGKWFDPKESVSNKQWTEKEKTDFIRETMRSLRGTSTYQFDYCAHLSPEFKTRPFIPKPKKLPPCKPVEVVAVAKESEIAVPPPEAPKMALKDTELMRLAKQLYEQDMDAPTLKPLDTHGRIYGYVRPRLYKTGLSEYQGGIARVAYELVRDNRIPKYEAANGARPKWGYPPEGTRQPELDGIPLDQERLY